MFKFIFLLFVPIVLFGACHALVNDEFADTVQVPVLNAVLQADSSIKVHVSLSAKLSDAAPFFASNALVSITDSDGNIDTLKHTLDGWYSSKLVARVGKTYTCVAKLTGFKTIEASTTVPHPTVIDSLVFTDNASRGEEGEKISAITFRLHNNKAIHSFWEIKLKSRGMQSVFDMDSKTFIEEFTVQNRYFYIRPEQDSVMLSEPSPLEVFSNRKMKGNTHQVKLYVDEYALRVSESDTLFIELNSIDQSFYNYKKSLYIYVNSNSGGLGSMAQNYKLHTNVKNGLGLFTATSVSSKDFELINSTIQ